ncbi:MAG TPA: NADPH-dependent 7-cyano-7-deazaguanine reductase QueF [Gammaproteobacteria bacterium]|nr:NADPH-dependent 7-cyano-7-deazaguanine reductase QueF [Gammaproteobacteria bacterium]
MQKAPADLLDTFPNPAPERDYWIHIAIPEFTCLCPKTGQPDFAHLDLHYVPGARCVELKSLKLYIWAFRETGAFHEAVTNRILTELAAVTDPRYMRLSARFNVRGGTYPTITVERRASGWQPAPTVALPETSD